jgi:ornithine cyclodeaminase
MLYINETTINEIGINWKELISEMEKALVCLKRKDIVQPIKPYLRYKNLNNRIIAMPAYVGGKFNVAGIKWIASFPGNLGKHLPRAHSITVLNNAETGVPIAVINTPLISILRTASISGLFITLIINRIKFKKISVGIIGFGPIGQFHLKMLLSLFKNNINEISIFDIRPIKKNLIPVVHGKVIKIVNCWEKAYLNQDIIITTTVSDKRYINIKPKKGSILLNVSLRDYKNGMCKYFRKSIVVDDWTEVCRENTDIENFYLKGGLKRKDTISLVELLNRASLKKILKLDYIMFNPMGMAIFDIATAKYYMDKVLLHKKGVELE